MRIRGGLAAALIVAGAMLVLASTAGGINPAELFLMFGWYLVPLFIVGLVLRDLRRIADGVEGIERVLREREGASSDPFDHN